MSRIPKLILVLGLLTSISCQQATTTNNSVNTTTNTSAQTTTSTTTQSNSVAQGPGITPSQTPTPTASASPTPSITPSMTREEALRLKKEEALKLAEKQASNVGPASTLQPTQAKPYVPAVAPEALPKGDRDNQIADTNNLSRATVRYYNFLTEIRGLNLNLPKEMVGGASAVKAVDVLQFTFKNQPMDKPIVVLVAEFNDPNDQARGMELMRKLGADGRKTLQAKNYSILIKGGDDKLHKILTDSLEQFR